MKWSFRVCTFAGIGVYVHVTFLLLVVYLFLAGQRERGLGVAMFRLALVLAVFFCVLLHEFGHALAARWFGIGTRDITLLPTGGVARLESIPRRPLHEFVIAIAGPLVNVALALAIALFVIVAPGLDLSGCLDIFLHPPGGGRPFSAMGWEPFLGALIVINAFMVCFNLVPAFPMDGGRILRSLLAIRLRYDIATMFAARCGQLFAVGFILLDVMSPDFSLLSLIAIFVFIGAAAEANAARLYVALDGLSVLHGAEPEMLALTPDTALDTAARMISGSQSVYPVFDGGRLLGVVEPDEIVAAARRGGEERLISDVPLDAIERVSPETALQTLFERMIRRKLPAVAVTLGDRFLAIVTPRSIHACAQRRLLRRPEA